MDLKTIVFMGRPGSGKGTQAKLLSETIGYDHFGTGVRLRALREEDPIVGKKIAETIDAGHLMPHWFASHMVVEKLLTTPTERGIIFDGSNRTLAEAELFFEVAAWLKRPYRVVSLVVSEEVLMKRIESRGDVAGRADDAAAIFKTRVEEYDRETKPALAYLQSLDLVVEVNGEGDPQDIQEDIIRVLSEVTVA